MRHPFGCHEARRAARGAGEHRLVPPSLTVVKRGGNQGYLRRSLTNSEGAGAEREGFEPSVGF